MNQNNSKYYNNIRISKEWISSLKKSILRANSEGLRVVVIAVARKMSRLLQYYINLDQELAYLLNGRFNSDNIVITEHAIPLFLANASERDTEVIILDDLIMYGDTVETISENVYYLTGIRSKIISMAASKDISYDFMWGKVLFPYENSSNILTDSELAPFTIKNSWDILSLDGPIDLEYPIFYADINIADTKRKAIELKGVLKSVFPEDYIYSISHKIPNSNKNVETVSIVFRDDSYERINCDFFKVRFYITEKGLKIVYLAPNIWDTPVLDDDSFVFNEIRLLRCWHIIKDHLKHISIQNRGYGIPSIFRNLMQSEFYNRIEHTAIIWANYLSSVDSAIVINDYLQRVFRNVFGNELQLQIDVRDLNLIAGPSISDDLFSVLRNVTNLTTDTISVSYGSDLDNEFIASPLLPAGDMREVFLKERFRISYLAPNISAALALTFHNLRKEYGLINNRHHREDRVKVGETFDSLFKLLSASYSKEIIPEKIHRWIDERIDLGIVVPKYEFVNGPFGYRIWRRYFRAGEREDTMVTCARVAMDVTTNLFNSDELLSYHEFKEYVGPILRRLMTESNGQINLQEFSCSSLSQERIESEPLFGLWVVMILLGMLKWKNPQDIHHAYIVEDGINCNILNISSLVGI